MLMDINEDMKKNIWLWNHYATNMYFDQGGRHYWFAKYLRKNGYKATVFAANTKHNSEGIIDTEGKKYITKETNSIPFVFVKTSPYKGNGFTRIWNMSRFAINLFLISKKYAKKHGMPDVILASSVHPLTLVAGICAAKRLKVPCICEVRDLWPETLVAYGSIKKNSLIAKILYAGEKWIYKKADKLIFTMEGGKDYIIEKGWGEDSGGPVDLDKVFHINNGVDLAGFDYNKKHYKINDEDLKDDSTFKVIYAGSIRTANNLGLLLDAAKVLQERGGNNITCLVWGDGNELQSLKQRVIDENVYNVVFKGRVIKKYVPHILSQGQVNISIGKTLSLYKYGGSLNKMFEYFASGNPTLFTYKLGYSICEKFKAGVEIDAEDAEEIAEGILYFEGLSKNIYNEYAENAIKAAKEYDYKVLTNKLEDVILTL